MTGPAIDAALDARSANYLPPPDALATKHELRQYIAHVEAERDRAFQAMEAMRQQLVGLRRTRGGR